MLDPHEIAVLDANTKRLMSLGDHAAANRQREIVTKLVKERAKPKRPRKPKPETDETT
jgi:hypothetical protein